MMSTATGVHGDNTVFCSLDAASRVALTIDDAPSLAAPLFKQLLDLLKELIVQVSFQVISSYAAKSEEHMALLRRAVAEGHHLVNHSVKDAPCIRCSKEEFRAMLLECQALIDGISPGTAADRWFRPPSGVMSAAMRQVCREEGFRVVLGDAYSDDPHVSGAEWHVRTLLRATEAGSVIIIHCPEVGLRSQTLDVVPTLVAALRGRGLELATVAQHFPLPSQEPIWKGSSLLNLETSNASLVRPLRLP